MKKSVEEKSPTFDNCSETLSTFFESNFPLETNVLFECEVECPTISVAKKKLTLNQAFKNGRCNYLMFEQVVATLTGLRSNGQGAKADLVDDLGNRYEVKAYHEPEFYGGLKKYEFIHTAASCAFTANNRDKEIRGFLEQGFYEKALNYCKDLSYNRIDYFIYTNTRDFKPGSPLRFIVIPKGEVMSALSKEDPRILSRQKLLDWVKKRVKIG